MDFLASPDELDDCINRCVICTTICKSCKKRGVHENCAHNLSDSRKGAGIAQSV